MRFSIRKLTEDEWLEFSRIRLKALQTDPNVFASSYQRESQFAESQWRSRLRDENSAIFIILENETPIGITGISADREDAAGKRAVLWGSWLEPRVRGKGLSKLMYRTRINWAKSQPTFEKVVVAHRASNLASKYAGQKHGFVKTHEEEIIWADGVTEKLISYELQIKQTERS